MHELCGLRSPADEEWDVLRPLSRLAFLSISNNYLHALPAAVAAMTQLQVRGPRRAGAGSAADGGMA